MPFLRSSTLVVSSLTLAALLATTAACSSDPSSGTTASGSGSGGSGGGSSGTGGGNTSACPQVDSMLDLSSAPGPGDSNPKPTLSASCTDSTFVVDTNGIPHYTFVPITPNPLKPKTNHYEIPREPKEAAATTEIPLLGIVAFAVNGIPIFGPNEGPQPAAEAYGDPVYNNIMDPCFGHTSIDMYHYHALLTKCLLQANLVAKPWMSADPPASEASPIVAWSLDGFPIYGPQECADKECAKVVVLQSGYEKIGNPKTNAHDAYAWKAHADDATFLDECNGHEGPNGDYHYHATAGFPYILGCYRGTPSSGGMMGGPKSCTMEADCAAADACPMGSKGCTCQQGMNGKVCVPTCSVAADCPMGPMGQLQCNQGVCTP